MISDDFLNSLGDLLKYKINRFLKLNMVIYEIFTTVKQKQNLIYIENVILQMLIAILCLTLLT